MSNSSRRNPRRATRQWPRHLILYASAIVLGLALGSTLVVVVMPRKKAVAQTIPVGAPQASPVKSSWLTSTWHYPVSIPTPTPPLPLPPVVETLRDPSIETPAPVVAKALEVKVAPPRQVPLVVVKRMHNRSQADILELIERAPHLTLDKTTARAESIAMVKAALQVPAVSGVTSDPTLALLDRRADLAGLPFRRGSACRLTSVAARELAKGANEVKFLNHDNLVNALSGSKDWLRPERVSAMMQVVMALIS